MLFANCVDSLSLFKACCESAGILECGDEVNELCVTFEEMRRRLKESAEEKIAAEKENKNVYIVIVPDPDHPLRHHFNYFVYAPDSCDRPRLVSEGIHFDFDSATIDAILDYLSKEVL